MVISAALVDAPWLPAVRPFLVASSVALVAVPGSMVLARRIGRGAIAEPDRERDIHARPTPRLGGLGMWLAFALALLLFGGGIPNRGVVLVGTLLVTVVMAVDDILQLRWWVKLVLQAAVGVLVAVSGVQIAFFASPFSHGTSLIYLGVLALPVTVAWLMVMQNSINFLDGSDGVAAGVVAIVAGVCLLAAINRLGAHGSVQGDVIVLSGALMGCCFGFLVFNFAPARVFMGDSGSHFLGLALGMITILGLAKVAVGLSLAVPVIALGLPIGDTAFAIVRRSKAGISFTQADAGHLHHRLLARGLSARETALVFYLTTAILGCVGLAIFGHRRILDVAAGLALLALLALFIRNARRPGDRAQRLARSGDEAYVVVPGRRAATARIHHGGESD
ncbi:MAG: MraY family glycosyltransferase [Candidatus Dormibacteria bacterium]